MLMSLLTSSIRGEHGGPADAALARFLHEDHDALRRGAIRQLDYLAESGAGLDRADLPDAPDDGDVMQLAALVLPSETLPNSTIVGQRHKDARGDGSRIRFNPEPCRSPGNAHRRLRLACRFGDLLRGAIGQTAAKLSRAVHYHFRSVGGIQVEPAAVAVLPHGGIGRGKRVLPAIAVPVIHVFAENDRLGVELLEQTIRGRTARASLGSEQFHQHARAGWRSASRQQRRPKKEHKQTAAHRSPLLIYFTSGV